jgi:hypothetical protein
MIAKGGNLSADQTTTVVDNFSFVSMCGVFQLAVVESEEGTE